MTQQQQERTEAITKLRELVNPGDTVYTILRHVSRSGMSRVIGVTIMHDGEPRDITAPTAKALGLSVDRDCWGVKVSGCGMDMGFHLVYELGARLWFAGVPCVGKLCQSNDHTNGDRDYTSGKIHQNGGYALRQAWL